MYNVLEEHGAECNRLVVSKEEYHALDLFLKNLGVRSRIVVAWTEKGQTMFEIEAGNPYKTFIGDEERRFPDLLMTEEELTRYKM